MAIAISQFTICDLNDITTSNTAPLNPSVDQLWLDTSITPNHLKKWNGVIWDQTGASSLEELDPAASGRLTTVETTILQNSEDILLKVSQTEVDTSINDANAYADALHQEGLDLLDDKVNNSDFDDLTATVTSHTTALSLVDGKISASISGVQTSADTANANIATINSFMDFTEEGLVLGKEGGENDNLKVKITNSEMDFLDNGIKVAYISNQQMEIEKAKILSSIVVGNHLIEKYDSNITLIKWIG